MSDQRYHVCVWSGKRGGFGALTPTIDELARRGHRVSIVVTDQHLYKHFGSTVEEVRGRYPIAAAIDMEQSGDGCRDRARAIGVCLTKSVDVLENLAPDILLVIGDRGEVFAACIAAHNLRIPIAHVQGGDVSGSLDEPVRHAITKLAHIHFPSTKAAAKRIISMGEDPRHVHVVGDTHVDQILMGSLPSPDDLRLRYDIPKGKPFLIVLQHSDSTDPQNSASQMVETILGTLSFGLRTLFVYPCSDQGYEGIIKEIEKVRNVPGVTVHKNIQAADFIGLQSIAGCMIGNSSAGLIEAPYFKLPAVNVGLRQIGREHADNVIHVPYRSEDISDAIARALNDIEFQKTCRHTIPPFGDGKAYKHIVDVIDNIKIDCSLLNKRMTY